MKYRLYSSSSGWSNQNASLETYLNIPDEEGTLRYADESQVDNPENADYEKYILPVCTEGRWKCDDQFDPSELVDYDSSWFLRPE